MQKILQFIFYHRGARLTLAFVKNLCFSNSAAVGLNRKDTGFFIILITQQENLMERKTSSSGFKKKKGFGD